LPIVDWSVASKAPKIVNWQLAVGNRPVYLFPASYLADQLPQIPNTETFMLPFRIN
jgi:hypothetical protein